MRLSAVLLALTMHAPIDVDIIDSRDDSRFVFIVVNKKCRLEVSKQQLKDYDLVVQKVMDLCGVQLDAP